MRKFLLPGLIAALLICSANTHATHLKVVGLVTNKVSGAPVPEALVRVYKDGVKQYTMHTASTGRYEVRLDNNAQYVLRFSFPGHITKCFTVDTHGPVWENDLTVEKVFVEMTLFPMIEDLDLSFFDLPMGMARFQPMTGHLVWDEEYDARIREQVENLMGAYERLVFLRFGIARNEG